MALYVNNTPIRKLVRNNTTLHSFKVNGTEVFNDTITRKITTREVVTYQLYEIYSPPGATWQRYTYVMDEYNVDITVNNSRADGLPLLDSNKRYSVGVGIYNDNGELIGIQDGQLISGRWDHGFIEPFTVRVMLQKAWEGGFGWNFEKWKLIMADVNEQAPFPNAFVYAPSENWFYPEQPYHAIQPTPKIMNKELKSETYYENN